MNSYESVEYMVVGDVSENGVTHRIYFHKKPDLALGKSPPKGAAALAQVWIKCATEPIFVGMDTFEEAEIVLSSIVSFFKDFDAMEGRGESAPFHIAFEIWGITPSGDDQPDIDLATMRVVKIEKRLLWKERG